jgi:hypothetical protein
MSAFPVVRVRVVERLVRAGNISYPRLASKPFVLHSPLASAHSAEELLLDHNVVSIRYDNFYRMRWVNSHVAGSVR